jgi:hypothetical protein
VLYARHAAVDFRTNEHLNFGLVVHHAIVSLRDATKALLDTVESGVTRDFDEDQRFYTPNLVGG